MSEICVVMIAKVIEAGMDGDIEKLKAYGSLIAECYSNSGDERAARIIAKRLDGSYKNEPRIVALDNDKE